MWCMKSLFIRSVTTISISSSDNKLLFLIQTHVTRLDRRVCRCRVTSLDHGGFLVTVWPFMGLLSPYDQFFYRHSCEHQLSSSCSSTLGHLLLQTTDECIFLWQPWQVCISGMSMNVSRHEPQLTRSTIPSWRIFSQIPVTNIFFRGRRVSPPLLGRGGTRRSRIRIRIRTCSKSKIGIRIRNKVRTRVRTYDPVFSRDGPRFLPDLHFCKTNRTEVRRCFGLSKPNRFWG